MSIISEHFDLIKVFGRYRYPPYKIAIILDLPKSKHDFFIAEWSNAKSNLRLAWEAGKALGEVEVMEALDKHAASGQEGAGEAAKALAYLKEKHEVDDLVKSLFGV